jgi:hypothetical protein
MRYRAIAIAGLALLACACTQPRKPAPAPPATRVAYRAAVEPGTPRYEEPDDVSTSLPQPFDNAPPIYPPTMIALHLPLVTVKAKVIVDADGRVSEVRIVAADASMPRPPEFDAAVRDAVLQWGYMPLTFTRWEEVKDAQGNVVDSRPASIEKKPFSLDYEFRFELRDGRPVVEGAAQAR